MGQVNVRYGGDNYSIKDRSLTEIQSEIFEALDTQGTCWLEVDRGYSHRAPTLLAVSRGTSIALTVIGSKEHRKTAAGAEEHPPDDADSSLDTYPTDYEIH